MPLALMIPGDRTAYVAAVINNLLIGIVGVLRSTGRWRIQVDLNQVGGAWHTWALILSDQVLIPATVYIGPYAVLEVACGHR